MTVEKIYHVETQEDYDSLMKELESKGYTSPSGALPSDLYLPKKNTCVVISGGFITECGPKSHYEKVLSDIPIETYKAPQIEVNPMPLTEFEAYKVLANVFPDTAQGIETKLSVIYANGGRVDNLDNQVDALRYAVEALPSKVTVPQFVADWFEKNNKNYVLGELIKRLNNEKEGSKIFEWKHSCLGRFKNKVGNAQEVIARMYLDGYEVEQEKEKLYTVYLGENIGVVKLKGKVTLIADYKDSPLFSMIKRRLTEKEIRDFNEGYWIGGFAKEVTE